MVNDNIVQKYVENFRRYISKFMLPGLGMNCIVYPAKEAGAIILFIIGKKVKNENQYKNMEDTVNQAIMKVNPKAFGGNLEVYKFSGTNINLHHNRIMIVKGEDVLDEWNEQSAKRDID